MRRAGISSGIVAGGVKSESHGFGPVVADRIMRIRNRLASGRYPLDVATLATVLIDYEGGARLLRPGPNVAEPVAGVVKERLAAAMRTMDYGAMLILQLEFVEQLSGAEIAALLGADAGAIADVRSAALGELSERFSAGRADAR